MSDAPLIALHGSYNARTALFSEKRDAEGVASRVRAMLARRFVEFPERAISVEGKKGKYYIEFPRIRMIWQPASGGALDIAAEVSTAATLFADCYTVKEDT